MIEAKQWAHLQGARIRLMSRPASHPHGMQGKRLCG